MTPLDPLSPRVPEPAGATGRAAPSAAAKGEEPRIGGDRGRIVPTADLELPDLLTVEEREFLARRAEGGSLTYGPDGRPSGGPPLPTGRRIDLKG